MLHHAYKAALANRLEGQCTILHYADAFETLWSDVFAPNGPLLILWDTTHIGNPAKRDDMLLEKHLTPLDWALAWSIHHAKAGQPIQRIVVIDLTNGSWQKSWAWQLRHQLLADMPWLSLVAPVPGIFPGSPPSHKWLMSPNSIDHDAEEDAGVICRSGTGWTLAPGRLPESIKVSERDALITLHHMWAASLNQGDEHHDVNNVVGARVLLLDKGIDEKLKWIEAKIAELGSTIKVRRPTDSVIVDAFLTKIAWTCRPGQDHATEWKPRSPLPEDPDLYGAQIRVSIYDDMLDSGWAAVLFAALFDFRCVVDSNSSPAKLIEFLIETAQFKKRNFQHQSFKIDPKAPTSSHVPEIIFLDLRLYGSQDTERLRCDVEKLIKVAREVADADPADLAWCAIDKAEIDDIEGWLTSHRGASDPRTNRALL